MEKVATGNELQEIVVENKQLLEKNVQQNESMKKQIETQEQTSKEQGNTIRLLKGQVKDLQDFIES